MIKLALKVCTNAIMDYFIPFYCIDMEFVFFISEDKLLLPFHWSNVLKLISDVTTLAERKGGSASIKRVNLASGKSSHISSTMYMCFTTTEEKQFNFLRVYIFSLLLFLTIHIHIIECHCAFRFCFQSIIIFLFFSLNREGYFSWIT